MLQMSRETPECWVTAERPVAWGAEEAAFLSAARQESSRKRTRLLLHPERSHALQEMLVAYGRDTYIRPNRHTYDESVQVVQGACDVLFFGERGAPGRVVRLGGPGGTRPQYCRVPRAIWHTVLVRSDELVLFEAAEGPHDPSRTAWANFAPPESEMANVARYRAMLDGEAERLVTPACLLEMDTVTPQVFRACDRVVSWGWHEAFFLRYQLQATGLPRVRVCAHGDDGDSLHEMLMAFRWSDYVRPSLHRGREESLYVLEGVCTYVFFDDTGAVTSSVPLGPPASGRKQYCRIPTDTYHMLLVESDVLAKETATGPFSRDVTEFPAWAPESGQEAYRFLSGVKRTLGIYQD